MPSKHLSFLLHLWGFRLPEVRLDATLQPGSAGFPVEGGQDTVGRRPFWPGDRRRLADPLRCLQSRGHPAFPEGAGD